MKSVRLAPELENRLRLAAAKAGVTESQFIREAIEQICDRILSETLANRLADYVGLVSGGGGRAEHSHEVFKRHLASRRNSQAKERRTA